MESPLNQFQTEEQLIRITLKQRGFNDEFINNAMDAIKNDEPEQKIYRNIMIREVAKILKGVGVSFRPYYVTELLSKITGLSPNYITTISLSKNPQNILKNGTKN